MTPLDLSRLFRLAPIAVPSDAEIDAAVAPVRADPSPYALELAWDGHRVLACVVGEAVRLVSSDHREWADLFPTITAELGRLRRRDVVLDGFLCALDDAGAPSFERLRRHTQKDPQRVIFACLDVLRVDGEDLRSLPLTARRERLVALLATTRSGVLVASEALVGPLAVISEAVRKLRIRGLVVRDARAPYPSSEGEAPTATAVASAPPGSSWLAIGLAKEALVLDRMLSPPPKVTNAKKLMFPRDGIAKQDVVAYYADVAPIMLRYLRDRPIVGQRWPDGIDDFTWYQHRMPPRAPDYVRAVWIEGNRRIVAETPEAIAWLANQAVLTFHGWASRCATLANPDWVVIDLDPGERTTWAEVIEVAVALRKLLELLALPSVPKTSGMRGLHVLVPIAPGHRVEQAHEFARRAGRTLAKVLPHLVSVEPTVAARGGRLYLDTLQNYVGKTLVLPYSLRAADKAPVSTPLAWSEVTPKLDPSSLTLATLRRRLETVGDLAAPLLDGTAGLVDAIAKMEP